MNDAIELPRRHRQQRITAREQPDRGPGDAIPIAQQLQQPRGKHCKAILAPLALLDAQQHALAIDIRHLQVRDFGDPQSGVISLGKISSLLSKRPSVVFGFLVQCSFALQNFRIIIMITGTFSSSR